MKQLSVFILFLGHASAAQLTTGSVHSVFHRTSGSAHCISSTENVLFAPAVYSVKDELL